MTGRTVEVCNCVAFGSAVRCSFHTQTDFLAGRRRCTCCSGLMNGEPGDLCGPCFHMGCDKTEELQ